jgi:tetratricopeptide (TPR) repeat protein
MISIVLIYVIGSILLTYILSKGDLNKWLLNVCTVLFLPIIGWCFPFIWKKASISDEQNYFEAYMQAQTDDIAIELKQARTFVNKTEELSVIPIEEALLINDHATRRKMVIEVLKIDAFTYIDALKNAVVNEDTETSHYAVTAISEEKRKLVNTLQKLAVEFEAMDYDAEFTASYADIIIAYLNSGFLDERTKLFYQSLYCQLVQLLIEHRDASEQHFQTKIDTLLLLHQYEQAEQTANTFISHYPNCEIGYLKLMEISFALKSYNQMKERLLRLKTSPVTLSNHALQIVRYWSEVVSQHEISNTK